MQFLKVAWSVIALPAAILRWMHSNIISPENDGKPIAPIRYDDDPSEIYLA